MKPFRMGPAYGYGRVTRAGVWLLRWHRSTSHRPWKICSIEWCPPIGCMSPRPSGLDKENMMKLRQISECVGSVGHLVDDEGLGKLPGLRGFLSDTVYEGTDPPRQREAGTIFIMVRDGKLQVTLREPTQCLVCKIEVASASKLFAGIEAAINGPSSLWQTDPNARKYSKRR